MKRFYPALTSGAVATLLLLGMGSGPSTAGAAGKKAITSATTKIVRGYNMGTPCDAMTIGNGNNPKVGPGEDLTNLSVSCSDDDKVSYTQLRASLPNPHACVATLGDLRKSRKEVTIVAAPETDNLYHCILDNITPKQFISGSKWQQ
ncbi:MAG: hypothetical protein AB7N91_15175 [Candidatus Tectimicrobiota bacterium]